ARPRPAAVGVAREHRRSGEGRPGADPGRPDRRQRRGRRRRAAVGAGARRPDARRARAGRGGAGPARRQREGRGARPLGRGDGSVSTATARRGALARLLGYFGRYRLRAILALLGMAIVSLATVALLFLVKKVVDEVLGQGASSAM